MAQTYFPFDSGSGGSVTELQWSKMARHWIANGVLQKTLNELQVFADSSGMQVKVKSGSAWIEGHFYESDAEETLPIAPADLSNPRVDRVIVRLDWAANLIELAVLQGIPAVTPKAPALTQNTSRWEIGLAQVTVGANVLTIAADKVTDERMFISSARYDSEVYASKGGTYQTFNDGVLTKVQLESVWTDIQNEYKDNVFIPKESGTYLIQTHSVWYGTGPAKDVYHDIWQDGSQLTHNGAGYNDKVCYYGRTLTLTAGRKYEFYIQSFNDGAQSTLIASQLFISRLR
jgi:hypothetical protein